MLSLTGCYGGETTLNLHDNSVYSISFNRKIGFCYLVQEINKPIFNINNKEYLEAQNLNYDDKGMFNLDNFVGRNLLSYFGKFGHISSDCAIDKNGFDYPLRDGVFDIGLNIEILHGFTLEYIWNKNLGHIKSYEIAQKVHGQYMNGTQAILNVGDMLADGGGYVRLNSNKINKNGVVEKIPNTVIGKYINKPVLGLTDVKESE